MTDKEQLLAELKVKEIESNYAIAKAIYHLATITSRIGIAIAGTGLGLVIALTAISLRL